MALGLIGLRMWILGLDPKESRAQGLGSVGFKSPCLNPRTLKQIRI